MDNEKERLFQILEIYGKTTLRAEELANWLKSPFSPFKQCIEFEGVNGFEKITGKKGIIFLKTITGQEIKEIILIYGMALD